MLRQFLVGNGVLLFGWSTAVIFGVLRKTTAVVSSIKAVSVHTSSDTPLSRYETEHAIVCFTGCARVIPNLSRRPAISFLA
jgi:hypothetical protein